MGKGIIWIRNKAKTIPVNFNKVSLKFEFVKILIVKRLNQKLNQVVRNYATYVSRNNIIERLAIIDVIDKCFSVSCNSSGCCNVR